MPFFVEWGGGALKGENPWTGVSNEKYHMDCFELFRNAKCKVEWPITRCNIKYTMVVLFNTAVWALHLSFHSHAAGERLDLVNFLPRFASDRPC